MSMSEINKMYEQFQETGKILKELNSLDSLKYIGYIDLRIQNEAIFQNLKKYFNTEFEKVKNEVSTELNELKAEDLKNDRPSN